MTRTPWKTTCATPPRGASSPLTIRTPSHLPHRMCVQSSFNHQQGFGYFEVKTGGQDLSRRQTAFFLPIDPRDEDHKDPEHIDFSVPRRAQYVHSAWKKHQDAVFWIDIDLAIREGLKFCPTRSNAIILQGTLPAYCIPKVERLKIGEVLCERPYLSPRPSPKISLRHDHDWTFGNDQLGSTVEQQSVG